jgi:phage tail-like protein
MAVLRDQPYANARFVVEIDGMETQAFAEVHLPEMSDDVVEYRDGTDKDAAPRKLPGRPRYGTMTLRRGFRGGLELHQWWREATNGGQGGRRNVLVRLLDEGATSVVAEWRLRAAWPARHWFSPLVAQGCETLMENVELACDSVELS